MVKRPSALILTCRVDCNSKFQSNQQDEVRIPHELSTKEDGTNFAFLQVTIGLFAVRHESDGPNIEDSKLEDVRT